MSNPGCIQLDIEQRSIIFWPFYHHNDRSSPLLISHTLSGPNDKTHLVSSMRESHDLYGPGSIEYPLALILNQAFQAGHPGLWAFSSSERNLAKAIAAVVEEGVYPYCKEFQEIWDQLDFQNVVYEPKPHEPPPNIEYRSHCLSAAQSATYTKALELLCDVEFGVHGLRSPTTGTCCPPGVPGPLGNSQGPRGPNKKDYRNIGKSHRTQKRW